MTSPMTASSSALLLSSSKPLSVIAHIDADSFYAQVEYRRLNIPRDKPLVVQQWSGLIAISYPARAFGIKRGDRIDVAKAKCPELICVHVETRDEKGSSSNQEPCDRSSQKACLDRYREASEEVMAVMARFCHQIERASIDEAYLDLTPEVTGAAANQRDRGDNAECDNEEREEGGSMETSIDQAPFAEDECQSIAGHRTDPSNALDIPLLLGTRLVAKLRAAVYEETGFTMSAGIAHNKMLAKLASSRNKPNKQTVVPSSAVAGLLQTIPLKDVRGLGGKLGDAVLAFAGSQCRTAADLQTFAMADLIRKFGPKEGTWLYNICRGLDEELVVAKNEAKSMQSFKSFEPVHHIDGVRSWLQVLAADLHGRLAKEIISHRRRATLITLQYRGQRKFDHREKWITGQIAELTPMVSRSMPMPTSKDGVPSEQALVTAGLTLFNRVGGIGALPCTRLALCASQFIDLPARDSRASILSFFGSSSSSSASEGTISSTSKASTKKENATASSNDPTIDCSSDINGGKTGGDDDDDDDDDDKGNVKQECSGSNGRLVGEGAERKEKDDEAKEKGGPASSSSSPVLTKAAAGSEVRKKKAEAEGGGEGGQGMMHCKKCGKEVKIEEGPDGWQEHQDWHVASELQQAYGGGRGGAEGSLSSNSTNGTSTIGQKRPSSSSLQATGKRGGGGSVSGVKQGQKKKTKNGGGGSKPNTLEKFWSKKA